MASGKLNTDTFYSGPKYMLGLLQPATNLGLFKTIARLAPKLARAPSILSSLGSQSSQTWLLFLLSLIGYLAASSVSAALVWNGSSYIVRSDGDHSVVPRNAASYTLILSGYRQVHAASPYGGCSSVGGPYDYQFGRVGADISGCARGTYIAIASCSTTGETLTKTGLLSYECACPEGQQVDALGRCSVIDKQSGPPPCVVGGIKACSSRPINFATGNKFKIQTDYRSSTPYGLTFTRTYNSLTETDNSGTMGSHWYHNQDVSLSIENDASTNSITIKASRGDSKVFTFTETPAQSGIYTSDGDVNLSLIGTSTGYQLTDPRDNIEKHNTLGQRLTSTNKAGLTRTYTYDLALDSGGDGNDNTLDKITDAYGHSLTLSYNSNGQIDSLTDPAGNVTSYAYDGNVNLISVTRPDNTTRTYHYENIIFIHALNGISDENGRRIETYAYNESGHAISSEVGGGIERVSIVYQSNGDADVTDTSGITRTYVFDTILGVRQAIGIVGGPCLACGDVENAIHDNVGNVIQSTDFNGNITTYTYDSRNLEQSRTEAFGTLQARTITTQWLPEYRLPQQINRPGQQINNTYNAQGLLVERALTDTQSGSPNFGKTRTTRYSYTTEGLLKTVDGPRTNLSDVASYEYDFEGNQSKLTNALGHITQITQYNPHGQPTLFIDSNGISTQLEYDSRRRLVRLSVAPGTAAQAITRYDYDGVGNLIRSTLPDNRSLTYEYDLANRITAIEDTQGNRLEYTLDAQGNRSLEQSKDPLGQLSRDIQRSYDALNRLQTIIGGGE